jgi:hypothetical protein
MPLWHRLKRRRIQDAREAPQHLVFAALACDLAKIGIARIDKQHTARLHKSVQFISRFSAQRWLIGTDQPV